MVTTSNWHEIMNAVSSHACRTLLSIKLNGFFPIVHCSCVKVKSYEILRSTRVMKEEIFKVYVRVLPSGQQPYRISSGHTALKRKLQINTKERRKIFDPGGI